MFPIVGIEGFIGEMTILMSSCALFLVQTVIAIGLVFE